MATEMDGDFCDPSSPWHRGTNENANVLLRQYFPKQTSLVSYGQAMLDSVAAQPNSRARKTLGYKTPANVFNEVLHWPVESVPMEIGGLPCTSPSEFASLITSDIAIVYSPFGIRKLKVNLCLFDIR